MKAFVYVILAGLAIAAILLWGPDGEGDVQTEDFLATDYAPLSKWFDEEFEVSYKHMTPNLVFDQVPLNDIFYQFEFKQRKWEPFSLMDSDISRRELLRKIAEFYEFDMSVKLSAGGEPEAVIVADCDPK